MDNPSGFGPDIEIGTTIILADFRVPKQERRSASDI